ncbi:MAG: VOC family protein [Bacteroidota bacterium]
MPVKAEFILYVKDQEKSKSFWSAILEKEPVLHVQGMTEFMITENCKLGIMPEKNIARIISPAVEDPSLSSGKSRCEIYLYVNDPDLSLQKAISEGAHPVSKCENRDWGDRAGYCADPDGHIVVFARKI